MIICLFSVYDTLFHFQAKQISDHYPIKMALKNARDAKPVHSKTCSSASTMSKIQNYVTQAAAAVVANLFNKLRDEL